MTRARLTMSSDLDWNDRCVLVQAPNWRDKEFVRKWLLAAKQAQAFWNDVRKDPQVENQLDRVRHLSMPDFWFSASWTLAELKTKRTALVLDLHNWPAKEFATFAMLTTMGFFARYDEFYGVTIPVVLTAVKVKAAVLETLHPEQLVHTISISEARAWKKGLHAARSTTWH